MINIVLTGASSDVGMQLLKQINEAKEYKGAVIHCQYYSNSFQLAELQRKLKNVTLILYRCNLIYEEEIERWICRIEEGGIPTHIIHLAAEKFTYMRIKEFHIEKLKRDMQIQLYSLIQILKYFLPMMSKQKFGRIVMLLSAYTLGTPPKFMSHYVTTKYALEGFMKSAAMEYAAKGITINSVSPGLMETKFLSGIDSRTAEINAKNSTMGRNVTLAETCSAILFLMDQQSGYINGVNLNVSGGDYM